MTNYNNVRLEYLCFGMSNFEFGDQIYSPLVGWVRHVLMPTFPDLDEAECLKVAISCWPNDDKSLMDLIEE